MSSNKRNSLIFGIMTWILITLMIIPTTGTALAQGGDPEVGDEVLAIGEISFEDDDIILTGTITLLSDENDDGEDGEDGEEGGDEVTFGDDEFVLAPAGVFNPSQLEEGDVVMLSGILLNDGETPTIRATDTVEFVVITDLEEQDDEELDENEEDEELDEEEDADACEREGHPVVGALADTFEVDYEEIAGWRCEHFGIGEIARAYLLADALAELADEGEEVDGVEEILQRRMDGEGWGNILRDYEDVHPSDLAPGRHRDKDNNGNGHGRGNSEDGPPGLSDDKPGRGPKNK